MPTNQVAFLLMAAYRAEVMARHREPVITDEIKANIKILAEALTTENPKFGVVLCGECGNGKTTMHYAMQRAINYLDDQEFFAKDYKGVNVGLSIVEAKDVELAAQDSDTFNSIRKRFMLGIEDVGNESFKIKDYGNERNPFVDLLEYRYNNQLFTTFTTNLPPKKFKETYGTRVADRLNEMMVVIQFNDKSFRK